MTIPDGTYKLMFDVTNPEPDGRKTNSWCFKKVWKQGSMFHVQTYPTSYQDIRMVGERDYYSLWSNSPGAEALKLAFEAVKEDPSDWLKRVNRDYQALDIIDVIVEMGKISMEQLQVISQTLHEKDVEQVRFEVAEAKKERRDGQCQR